jgi:hypothetical protein
MHRMRAGVSMTVACLAWVLSVRTEAAVPAVYEYKGNPFTLFSCGPNDDNTATKDCATPAPSNPFTSYTATDFVTATLTLDSPLPANLSLQDVRTFPGFALSMSDGQQTLTQADAAGMFAEVSTNAFGQIVQWRFVINTGGTQNGGIATIDEGTSIEDTGTLACCDPSVPGNLALNLGKAARWRRVRPN